MLMGRRELVKSPTGGWTTVKESLADSVTGDIVGMEPKAKTVKGKAKSAIVPDIKGTDTFDPIADNRWTITDVVVVKGYPIDPPKPHPVTGKPMTYMRFAVPIIKVSVRGNTWPDGVVLVITRSRGGVSIAHPNGEKTKTMGPTLARATLINRFGADMGDTINQIANG